MEKDNIKRYQVDIHEGLTEEVYQERIHQGLNYHDSENRTKTIPEIILKNLMTPFNILNAFLATAVIISGSFKNLLFLGVVICNMFISMLQEIHAKRLIDKLSILATSTAKIVRDGKLVRKSIHEIVLDDILKFDRGDQVVVDSIIKHGEVEVNESIITGETDPIYKKKGDMILSGSFITSGSCFAQVEHVGLDNYTSTISTGTKYVKKVNSEIMNTINRIIKVISIVIVPLGLILFFRQYGIHHSLNQAILNTVAAVIGMIPEGLVLLTSTVLAVGVAKLTRYQVLVEQLYGIETLARVDTICLDKTGTLTEGDMILSNVIPYKNHTKEELEQLLSMISMNFDDKNATIDAIKKKYPFGPKKEVIYQVPFTSEKKWSAVSFQNQTIFLGATEFLLEQVPLDIQEQVDRLSSKSRVILIAKTSYPLDSKELPKILDVVGFLEVQDHVRKEALQTLNYFREEGVDIKIISGDNVKTVTNVAERVGVKNLKAIDASTLLTDEALKEAVEKYQIFGRVTPIQKKEMVLALKEQGHVVAMTGDGVNDVLALKEADCSIAVASGSDAARNVSEMVLLDSNFDHLPQILKEGRQIINNIERSATLFLVKTIYATLLAICFLFIAVPYPFVPIQLTLTSVTTIGIPSFILALEPNEERVKKHFFLNIISKSIPTAVTIVESILIILICDCFLHFTKGELSTLSVLTTGFTSFILLFRLCRPFNLLRGFLFGSMVCVFLVGGIGLHDLFSLSFLPWQLLICLGIFMLIAYELYRLNLKLFMHVYESDKLKKVKRFVS